MNGSDSLLDPTRPETAGGTSFQLVKRGYDPLEVQAFARAVSVELQRLGMENEELRSRVRSLESAGSVASGTASRAVELDESSVAQYLGSETTRLLQAARDTAAGIVHRAEERADEIVTVAEEDARRLREQGVADAAHERRVAADEARTLIADASEQRRSVLAELARRRDTASTQMRELMRGRDVLVQALANVSGSANDLLGRLEHINVAPADFVNLDPANPDSNPGIDRGAVLKVDFAPPAPGTNRPMRPVPSPMPEGGPITLDGADGPDQDPDDGTVFTLEG